MSTKPVLAEVVTLYESNASDIVAMLRRAADNIESGECAAIRSMTAVADLEDGGIQVYGWGATDTLRSIAILQLGVTELSTNHLAAHGDEE